MIVERNYIPGYNVISQWVVATVLALLFLLPATVNAQANQLLVNGQQSTTIHFAGSCSYKWSNTDTRIGLAAAGTGDIASFTAKNTGSTPIVATVTATPQSTGFVYIPNANSDNVSVYDAASHAFVTNITVDNQPWAVTLSPDGSRVYILNTNNSNGRASGGTVSVINANTNTVVSTINVGKNALSITASADGTRLYVANKTSNFVNVISVEPNDVYRLLPALPATLALAVAVSNDGKRLYVTGDSNSNQGSLYIYNTADNSMVGQVSIGLNASGIVVSPDGSRVYVTNDYENTVSVINTSTSQVIATIPVGLNPYAITMSPAGDKLYVSNTQSKTVSVINTADNVVSTISLNSNPQGISISPNGQQVYVAGQNPDEIAVINTANNQVTSFPGHGQSAIAIGNFVSSGTNCSSKPITFTITVNPAPVITNPGDVQGQPSTRYGTPSTSYPFTVSGKYLSSGILVTAPAGFEVSRDNGISFTNSVTVTPIEGLSGTFQVFVRIKANAPATTSVSGKITLSATDATPVFINITGVVGKAPLIITANNITRFAGKDVPPLSLSYNGFVNGEGPAQLSTQPVVETTATAVSAIGKYPITVSGAAADNYSISKYVPGVLEIVSGEINAPTAFTPNGDGINDYWDIKNLNLYTNCTIDILNRLGQKVFQSVGYPVAWNGRYNQAELPTGTYYYIINLKNGSKPLSGYVAIIR